MIGASTIIPVLSLLKWPATLTGAILVFGLSTEGTLSLVSSNAHKMTQPIAVSSDFNMPPVRQIAELNPTILEPTAPANDGGSLIPQPKQTTSVALLQPAASALAMAPTSEPISAQPGRIGEAAVNLRSGPSKTSAKLRTLAAGTEVRIGEEERGWVHVWHADGDGWVYSSYLAGVEVASVTEQSRSVESKPSKGKAVEVGSRMTARADPDSEAPAIFKIAAGERVKILERRGNWLKVTTVSGDTGWIRAKS